MKSLLILISLFTVIGCAPSPMSKAKQDFACKDNGGVYEYVSDFSNAKCLNGVDVKNWQELIVTPKYYPEQLEQDI